MVFALRSALIAALFGAIVGMLIVGSKLANARQI
jgi:integral membrane sensor domain MASE1